VKLETTPCPACGGPDYEHYLSVRDRFETVPGQLFSIVRCSHCRLLYLNPRPDENSLPAFYDTAGYDPFISSSAEESLTATAYRLVRRFTMKRKAARVAEGLQRGAKALDVGCATGEMVAELKKLGFDAVGVEPNPKAAEFARDMHGLTVWTGGIKDVPGYAGPFDLITLWHVLEHLPDLRTSLERLRGMMSDTGRLAIAVPNPLSRDAGTYGDSWVAWDAPRHLYDFEPDVLLDLLRQSGFRAERRGAVAFDAFYHCLLSEKPGPSRFLRASLRGLASYARGITGGEGSSELYFAHKS
jgi:SAM-dependent methyltransferase